MKLAFVKVARESDALYQLQRSVPQKRDRFAPINASPEFKEACKKREDALPLRAELRETGADEKKLDRYRAKIHYRLTQLASLQAVGDRKQYLKRGLLAGPYFLPVGPSTPVIILLLGS